MATYILVVPHTLESRLAGVARVGSIHALETRVHTVTSITTCSRCHIGTWSALCWSTGKHKFDALATLFGNVH